MLRSNTYVDKAFINSWFAVSMVAEVAETGSPMDMWMLCGTGSDGERQTVGSCRWDGHDDLSYMRMGQRDVSKVGRSRLPPMTRR